TVAESVVCPAESDDAPLAEGADQDPVGLLVSAGRREGYRCIAIEGPEPDPDAPRVRLSGPERQRLRIDPGDPVRVATIRPGEGRARG
ncbi:MAG: hypothetical protein ACERLM_10655, partial [Acidimicrobiales bacterium]